MKGKIFDIKRFAVHDGPGIRTTVFLKGCSLHCSWRHNPEGISFNPELQFVEKRCIGCGACTYVCQYGVHEISNSVHVLNRNRCVKCGLCIANCPAGALSQCCSEITAEELADKLLEDRDFYIQSGGGVTFSGGECLCQSDFCAETMRILKGYGIHCAVDTSGNAARNEIDKVLPYADMFLYDIKLMDEDRHIKYTGCTNRFILDNIEYINSRGKEIEVRIPVIPTVNDDMMYEAGDFLKNMKMIKAVKLLKYNNLAGSKYKNLGICNNMPRVKPPADDEIKRLADILKGFRLSVIID